MIFKIINHSINICFGNGENVIPGNKIFVLRIPLPLPSSRKSMPDLQKNAVISTPDKYLLILIAAINMVYTLFSLRNTGCKDNSY